MPEVDHKLDRILVEPFPLRVLSKRLVDFVTEAAASISCPPDYIAVPMLGVLSTAIGTRRRIKVKDGWYEWAILWTATVGNTGSAKSPGLQMAAEPLYRFQSEFLEEHKASLKAVRAAATGTAKRPTHGKRPGDMENPIGSPLPPRILSPQQAFTTDATLEALNVCLDRNPHGIALVRDELTAWVLSMNEYKKGSGADRPHCQSIWNGSQLVVNRRNRNGPLIIPKPFVSVIGGLPPAMLGELCDERGREDGFIHRILFSFPDSMQRELTGNGVRPETLDRYCQFVKKLRYQGMIMCSEDPATVVLDNEGN